MKTILAIFIFFQILNFICNTENLIQPIDYIIYNKKVEIENDVTGTGNKLKDVVYISMCDTFNCPYKCCQGPINSMQCAEKSQCEALRILAYKIDTILFILLLQIPYFLLGIFYFVLKCLEVKKSPNYIKFRKFFYIYYSIIFPCFGICVLITFCKKTNIDELLKSETNDSKINNISVLFGKKEFVLENIAGEGCFIEKEEEKVIELQNILELDSINIKEN
jgi:hypothetical protein